MQNILLTIAFDGTNYHGFQVQQNALTICETLQNALQKLLGNRPQIKGSSRTDAGVHANGFCVSFFLEKDIPCRKIPLAINAHLPKDIRVLSAEKVSDDFHARYSSTAKRYIYKVRNSGVFMPFDDKYVYRVGGVLDVQAMHDEAQHFIGKHDFAAFASFDCDVEDTVRKVFCFEVEQKDDLIIFTVCADGYLYNMVRIMVGTLIEVGAGRMKKDSIPQILKSKNRHLAGCTVPAKGLFLDKVFYNEFV